MALVKTNYGLIYNDDGSLCTTIRDDDIPFAGVKSFAVEEGTTNLGVVQGGVNLTRIRYAYQTTPPTYYQVTDEKWLGTTPLRVHTGEGGIRFFTTNSLVAGTTYTFSIYVRPQATRTMRLFTDEKYGPQTVCPANQWTRLYLTSTPSSSLRWLTISGWQDNDVIDFAAPQLEFLPFATSFVDGTRAAPRLKIPFNYNGDWVLSFWFRPDWEWGTVPVPSARERTYNLASWGTPGTDGWLFRIAISNMPGYINFETYAPTVYSFANPANFGLNNRNWAYFVIVSDISNKLFKVYINGQLAMSQSNIDWDMPPEDYVSIGTRRFSSNYGAANGLFSNILIARYDPAVWTAEYIQELYNMRRPFSVPPRMPII